MLTLKVETKNLEEIRLTYFPVRGRAEIARLILVQAGVAYQDIRIKREDFLKVKYSPEGEKNQTHFNPFLVKSILPYGSLPILEYKGEVIPVLMFLSDTPDQQTRSTIG